MKLKPGWCALVGILLCTPLGAHSGGNLERTRGFVVMGYHGLLTDLTSGEGPYLRTLDELLGVAPDQRSRIHGQIGDLAKTTPNIMDFADAVVKLQNESLASRSFRATPIVIPEGPHVYSGDRLENALLHLTKGMLLEVTLKNGERFSGRFEEYSAKRLWIRNVSSLSILFGDILAVEAPEL